MRLLLFSKNKRVFINNVFSFFDDGIFIESGINKNLNRIVYRKSILESWFFLFFCEKLLYIKYKFFSLKIDNFVKSIRSIMKIFSEVFFFEFRLYGLGYRVVRYRNLLNCRVITFSLGISHDIHYILPDNVFIILGRKRFIIYSNNLDSLKMVYNHLVSLKRKNSYKLKGMFDVKKPSSFKKGKQKQH